MNLDNSNLLCFIALAESRSFTKAAQQVGLSQPAVSQQIAKLEEALGKTLIKRGGNLTLTNDGKIFFEYARRIVALHNEVLDKFKSPDLHGLLHFGLPEAFATMFLSDILIEFRRLHPLVTLMVECDLTRHLLERYKKGEFELVLAKSTVLDDFPHGVEIFSEKLVWVGKKQLLTLEENNLEPLSLVLSPEPCVYRTRALQGLDNINEKWRIAFCSHNYGALLAAVRAGMGITVLPKHLIPNDLDIYHSARLPELEDTHVSLLAHDKHNTVINTFEKFVLSKLHA
jgi:DNA-binding transcriptional LysR family regulator